jgi:hypothetical protein
MSAAFRAAYSAESPAGSPAPLEQRLLHVAAVLLDAIARSDCSRASVSERLLGAHAPGGILGDFRFDKNGDPTYNPVTVFPHPSRHRDDQSSRRSSVDPDRLAAQGPV